MSNWKIKLSLFLNYFVFGILLNSVGIVILQVITHYGIEEKHAAILEACKDLTLALVSFGIASFLPRIGYRRAMMIGMATVTVGCLVMTQVAGFAMTEILFILIGISFALIKVSVYSTAGLITKNPDEHVSFISTLEGIFQFGVLAGYWIFGFFISGHVIAGKQIVWTQTYWVLAAMTISALVLLAMTKLDEGGIKSKDTSFVQDFTDMIKLVRYPLVLTFIGCAFIYVFIEQGIQTWLPTFNNKILQLPNSMSVQVTSILALGIAVGRLLAGAIMRKIKWIYIIVTSLVAGMALVLIILPLSKGIVPGSVTGWNNAPVAAYIFPAIGFFLAPIYPILCSIVLSKLPHRSQSGMSGLIVIFSALGGTIGSRITGEIFSWLGGTTAFYCSLIPMTTLLIMVFIYKKLQESFKPEGGSESEEEGPKVPASFGH